MVMDIVRVRASLLANFGDSEGSTFCLVTALGMGRHFEVERGPKYVGARVIESAGNVAFTELLQTEIPDNAHVLVILPDVYFRSPSTEELGPRRKLAVMACTSTPTSLEAIAHFVRIAERTDPARQDAMSDEFFTRGQATATLRFVDGDYGTAAEFAHLDEDLTWHEQTGTLDWGQQQLFPAGEISVLPVEVFGQNINSHLAINGTLALRSHPVLHSGTPSYLPEDQERLYQSLTTLRHYPLIATVRDGVIAELEATAPDCEPAARTLRAMCAVDSRYATILEIGFGINTGLELFPGNSAMNEVYGGTAGAVHFGLGLIPYTQYHLDLISPHTRVLTQQGEVIFGGAGATSAVAAV